MSAVETQVREQVQAMPVRAAASLQDVIISLAERGTNLETIERLIALRHAEEARLAERAFVAAMTQFKQNPPKILKSAHVEFLNNKGFTTAYDHATLGDVCNAIMGGLAAVGITHRWDVVQKEGTIHVTCVLTHLDGHSMQVTMFSGRDDSGNKNPIQQVSSAVTYLQRYTLLAVTGFATLDDDDGRAADDEPADEGETVQTITAEQAAQVRQKLKDMGRDEARFLNWARLRSIESVRAESFQGLMEDLDRMAKHLAAQTAQGGAK